MPDFAYVHAELSRPGVTRMLLWEEYRELEPGTAFSYSQFNHHYNKFVEKLKISMRQTHVAGECIFVDFSGKRLSYVDLEAGVIVMVELFIAVLGLSNYTFARAVATQQLPDWIAVNVQMLEFFGGVPEAIVPDNLRSAVTKAGRNLVINRTYQEFSQHYITVIRPARPRRPKDKAKVEVHVRIMQGWIIGKLRNRKFFCLAELNAAIDVLVVEFNNRAKKGIPSRRQLFEEKDLPTLKPLPQKPFEMGIWTSAQKVPRDYHVPVERHWYSVPYKLVGSRVEARSTATAVEFFHDGKRIAVHVRGKPGGHTTLPEHQHANHRSYATRSPENFMEWAVGVGPNVCKVMEAQFEQKQSRQAMDACNSLKSMARQYSTDELESAAKRALELKSPTVTSVRRLLRSGKHALQREASGTGRILPPHENERGADYFDRKGSQSC